MQAALAVQQEKRKQKEKWLRNGRDERKMFSHMKTISSSKHVQRINS
jgi:hypothetical protein